ncbi:MMPL family transporter [Rhodococcus sp. X156]|uniref:MMPL family transporter n=1 Tax=Rhodococcus sp. X156 TaxID=2499145 RepID=UPI000FD6EFF0|nr:MMPL family transporter [Rhodococcus sp. X156]
MATLLAQLGRWSFLHRWTVVAAWVVLVAVVGTSAALFKGPTPENSFSIPGTESQQAIDTLAERFPAASGSSATIVITGPAGTTVTDPAVQAQAQRVLAAAQQLPHVVPGPAGVTTVTSPDGAVLMAQLRYDVQTAELGDSDRTALKALGGPERAAGLTVEVSGELVQGGQGAISPLEGVGLLLALAVLVVTFGSLLAAGMPLLTGLVGVAVGVGGLVALSGVVEVSSTAPILALMLGLAVGIDYSLFIVSRHRSQLATGMRPEDSAALAVGTAGSAVVFAGLTVMIALVGLTLVGIPFLGSMGLVAAATVLITVLVALTLLPAMLGLAGERLVPVPGSRVARRQARGNTMGERWVRLVTRFPVLVVIGVVAGLGALALPVQDIQLGLPSAGTAPPESTQRKAYDLVAQHLGPGVNGPLTIVVDTRGSGADVTQSASRVAAALRAVSPDVAQVTAPMAAPSGDLALVNVVPRSGPDSEETTELVRTIRDAAPGLGADTGSVVQVTGPTALGIDVSQGLSSALPLFLVVVVGLALLLLAVVFRSVLVPLKAAAGFLLTVGASLGCVVAVFQWGWLSGLLGVDTPGPITSFLPVLLVGLLFGLAMDYEVFLVTRMREEHVHGADPDEAVRVGFREGARVVTAAALIMTSVFVGFALSDDPITKSIALALAIGVLIDAFVVRMTLVPAVLALFGRRAWWLPAWADRVLPRVDIEGEQLDGERQALQAAAEDDPPVPSEVR